MTNLSNRRGAGETGILHKVPNFYDYLKHLTTLATGSIVLLATFAEKFPAAASWRLLLKVATAAFLLSVLSSLVSMFFTISAQRYEGREPNWEGTLLIATFLLSAGALFAGRIVYRIIRY